MLQQEVPFIPEEGGHAGEVCVIRAQQLPSVAGRAALSMANGLASIVTRAKATMLSSRTVLRIEESFGIASMICISEDCDRKRLANHKFRMFRQWLGLSQHGHCPLLILS